MNAKSLIPRQIIIILSLAVILNIARVVLFDSRYFVFLLWNVFLAILPFVISSILSYYNNSNKLKNIFFIPSALLWILLLPNAPYIVTDLIHISRGHGAPILFDAFLLFSCAYAGLILFSHSLSQIEKIIISKYGKKIASIKIPSIIVLTSIGVYMGRYLRFNSWDIFVDHTILGDTINNLSHPVSQKEAIIFILVCSVFLFLFYKAFKSGQEKE